jgi:protein-S-isoprenylcysteine O-methyltransferase Ste14
MRHVVYDVSSVITWACWGCVAFVWAIGFLQQTSRPADGSGERRDLASLAGIVVAAIAFALPHSVWHPVTLSSPWLALGGLVVLLPATAAAIWSRLVLGSMWSSAARTIDAHALRTAGPYAITRHPIYSAIIAMIIGTALAQGLGRWAVLAVAIVLLLKSKIAAEEQLLAQQFPEQYSRYRQRVPQLIPRLPREPGDSDRR